MGRLAEASGAPARQCQLRGPLSACGVGAPEGASFGRMRKLVLALAAVLVLAGAAGFFLMRPAAPPPEPPAAALAPVPVAPPPAPAPVAATPKHSDLPTVDVEAHPVHTVPEGEPPPAKPFTLRTRDGRVIDPASGRLR